MRPRDLISLSVRGNADTLKGRLFVTPTRKLFLSSRPLRRCQRHTRASPPSYPRRYFQPLYTFKCFPRLVNLVDNGARDVVQHPPCFRPREESSARKGAITPAATGSTKPLLLLPNHWYIRVSPSPRINGDLPSPSLFCRPIAAPSTVSCQVPSGGIRSPVVLPPLFLFLRSRAEAWKSSPPLLPRPFFSERLFGPALKA